MIAEDYAALSAPPVLVVSDLRGCKETAEACEALKKNIGMPR